MKKICTERSHTSKIQIKNGSVMNGIAAVFRSFGVKSSRNNLNPEDSGAVCALEV